MTATDRGNEQGRRAFTVPSVRCISLAVAADPSAPSVARRFAGGGVEFLGCSVDPDDLALLVSEVVTNAVQVTEHEIEVSIRPTRQGGVRVEVHDAASGTPEVQHAPVEQLTGRGLMIVERVAQHWGVDRTFPGKTVWFELDPV